MRRGCECDMHMCMCTCAHSAYQERILDPEGGRDPKGELAQRGVGGGGGGGGGGVVAERGLVRLVEAREGGLGPLGEACSR